MSKIKWFTEHRMVCANINQTGHRGHLWFQKDLKAAKKSLEGMEQDLQRLPEGHWRSGEYPYKIQTRTVTKWVDAE